MLKLRGLDTKHRDEIEALRSPVDQAVRKRGTDPKAGTLLRKLQTALSDEDATVDNSVRKELISIIEPDKGWDSVKLAGRSGIPTKHRGSFDSLVETLDKIGIVIITEGELESLHDTVDLKGGAWLREALSASAHTQGSARKVVARAENAAQIPMAKKSDGKESHPGQEEAQDPQAKSET